MTATTPVAAVAALILLAVSGPLVAQGDARQERPCSAPEYRQFDFWIGDWEVTGPDGSVAGHNRIESLLDGCLLMENWQGAQGSTGKSFNQYYERDGRWHQTWVDGAGGRLELSGGWQEGKMVLSGEMPGREGGTVRHEISWEPRDDGSVRQYWRASRDGGESWDELFDGVYRRRSE